LKLPNIPPGYAFDLKQTIKDFKATITSYNEQRAAYRAQLAKQRADSERNSRAVEAQRRAMVVERGNRRESLRIDAINAQAHAGLMKKIATTNPRKKKTKSI
jgi:hypothetical protein